MQKRRGASLINTRNANTICANIEFSLGGDVICDGSLGGASIGPLSTLGRRFRVITLYVKNKQSQCDMLSL